MKIRSASIALAAFIGVASMLLAPKGSAFVLNDIRWPGGATTVHGDIFNAFDGYVSPNGISWNDAFAQAAASWNTSTVFEFSTTTNFSSPCSLSDERNGVDFELTVCGGSFGANGLAVTLTSTLGAKIVESDIIFNGNSTMNWNVYNGPLSSFAIDFRRVAAHELGHVMGLGHSAAPNLMAAFIGNTQAPLRDDIVGVDTLYGGCSEEQTISPYSSIQGTLAATDCFHSEASGVDDTLFDAYRFTIPVPGQLTISMSSVQLDTYLILTGGPQNIRVENDDGGGGTNSYISLPVAPGTYFIDATSYYEGETGIYTLTAQFTPDDPPEITSPAPLTELVSDSTTVTWEGIGHNVSEWWLYVGSTPGASDLYDSGSLGTATQTTVQGLPTDGRTLYVRLFYSNGNGWPYVETQITAADIEPVIPEITAPPTLPGSTLAMSWSDNGLPVDEWWLYVGSSPGASDLYDSGSLGTATETTVEGLPTDGRTLYVRLFYTSGNGWPYVDAQVTAADIQPAIPEITAPATIPGSALGLSWSDNGTPVDEWWLYVGSTPGASDLHDSGSLGTATQTTVEGLPTDGRILYVRLFYTSGNGWPYVDAQVTAADIQPVEPEITAPAMIPGPALGLSWSDNGTPVDEWWLYVGSTPGASDLHDSGSLGTATQTIVDGLPTDGRTLYVRLFYTSGNGWPYVETQVTAADIQPVEPEITAPAMIPGPALGLSWSDNGTPVDEWWLYVGSTPGASDLHDSGSLGTAAQTVVYGLPTDGRTLYLRLFYSSGNGWPFVEAQVVAADIEPATPEMTAPATLQGATLDLNWNANGTPVDEWWLYVGSTPGASDLYDSGSLGTATQTSVDGLPTDGRTLYVRLFYSSGNGWPFIETEITAADIQ